MSGTPIQRESRSTQVLRAAEAIQRAAPRRPHIVMEVGLLTISRPLRNAPAAPCPLKKSLLSLLQEAADEDNTGTAVLAARLSVAPATIRNKFQQVLDLLQVHNRRAAVAFALAQGWITARDSGIDRSQG